MYYQKYVEEMLRTSNQSMRRMKQFEMYMYTINLKFVVKYANRMIREKSKTFLVLTPLHLEIRRNIIQLKLQNIFSIFNIFIPLIFS